MHFRYASVIGGIFLLLTALLFQSSLVAQEEAKPKVRDLFISLDVRDRSFAEIIDGIRQQTNKNIIYDEEIKEIYVTIRLIQVPWRQALDVIAKEHNCLVEEVGLDVIKISKPPTVTMEFEGADIRDIINQIATIANRNIVISEQVKGSVSLRLKNVPWQDALEAIIKTRGYVIVREKDGRILRVVPPEEIETQLETRIFKLRFVRPKSVYVAQMDCKYFKKAEGKISSSKGAVQISRFSLLNALEAVLTVNKGRITYDDATNTLVITDVKPKIDKMAEIIRELDREPRQVFLDIKFIRTTNTDIFDFGIDNADEGIRISQGFGSLVTRLPFSLGRSGWEDAIAAAPKSQLEEEGVPSDANITEAVPNPVTFGTLDFSGTRFILRILKRDVKSKVIQAPKIITLDHHESTIFVGRTISFAKSEIVQNDNGTTSVELTEADASPAREGFQILVIPHVIPGTNKVQLTVIPSNDQLTGTTSPVAGFNRFEAGGDAQARIDLPEVTQQVVVTHMILESGQTAVLGGLLKISQTETVRKIPLLGDIPIFGYFFKSKQVNKQKEDMFIFITPRLVQSAEDTEEKVKAVIKEKIDSQRENYKAIWQEKK